MQNKVRQIKTKNVRWIHIDEPGENEIQYLRDHFQFHPLDLQDCVNIAQRPKVDEYENYLFLILLFPYYRREERLIIAAEIDYFIGSDYLITVSDGKSKLIDTFFDDCMKSEVMRERFMSQSPSHLLYEILHRLQNGIFPMLDHVSKDIDTIEMQIFKGVEKRMVHDILLIKRNIVNFRRIVNAHKSTMRKLTTIRHPNVFQLSASLTLYYDSLVDRSKDIWETLEIQKETINAFQEANDSLISFKLNDAMRVLTAISVSILPATLLASIFGMNTVRSMPIVESAYGFWIVIAIMAAIVLGLMRFYKRKGWFD